MVEIAEAYRLVNTIAFAGWVVGYLGLTYLQLWREEYWPVHQTLPLLGVSTTLFAISSGLWFAGPLFAVVARAVITLTLVLVVLILLRPLYLLQNNG